MREILTVGCTTHGMTPLKIWGTDTEQTTLIRSGWTWWTHAQRGQSFGAIRLCDHKVTPKIGGCHMSAFDCRFQSQEIILWFCHFRNPSCFCTWHHSTWKQSSSRSLSTAGQLGIISANVRVGLNGAMVHWGYHRAAMVEVPSRYHGRAKVLAEKSEAGPRTCVHREPWSARKKVTETRCKKSRWNHIRLCPLFKKQG